jgi:mRNA-degrading endonuclease toxin of MazEF toxin-antitoxin module
MKIEQWDIVRFRINASDRDLHPGVVVSAPEWCADERKLRLNVLACSKRLPADGAKNHQVVLNGSDGLDFISVCGCEFFHIIARDSVTEKIGRVAPARRRAIGRKINEVLRLPL